MAEKRVRRTDFTPALMIPTEWACLCPVCGYETPIEGVTAHGDPALRNAVYRVDEDSAERWLRCDGCDTALEIQSAVVSNPPPGVV